MPVNIGDISKRVLDELKNQLADIWNSSLIQTDRELIEACVNDWSGLMVQSLAVMPGTPEAAALHREILHVKASLMNLAAAEKERVLTSFWTTVKNTLSTAVSIAIAVV